MARVATPEDEARSGELRRLVHAALDHLPFRYGEALEMRYIDGVSVPEIAARLKLSYKAAESVLSRSRAAFRRAFAGLAPRLRRLAPEGAGAGGPGEGGSGS
jgi:RNA polymerase sigma-70 factor (ECF subfamily)